MTHWRFIALLAAALPAGLPADEPAPPAPAGCAVAGNRILGPRSADRPLPLLAGDPTHGFHPACAATWAKLSPSNQPVPVVGCYRDSLLQIANDIACGGATGPLWVSSRWVLTSAERGQAQRRTASCEKLETGTYAATRDYQPDCAPQKADQPSASQPAARSLPAAPAVAPPSPPPAAASPPAAAPSAAAPTPTPAGGNR